MPLSPDESLVQCQPDGYLLFRHPGVDILKSWWSVGPMEALPLELLVMVVVVVRHLEA